MGIDFFATVLKGTTEYPKRLDQKEFGIRDGEGGEPAFVEEKPAHICICQCVVKNQTGNDLFFKPLDRLIEAKDGAGRDISIAMRCCLQSRIYVFWSSKIVPSIQMHAKKVSDS